MIWPRRRQAPVGGHWRSYAEPCSARVPWDPKRAAELPSISRSPGRRSMSQRLGLASFRSESRPGSSPSSASARALARILQARGSARARVPRVAGPVESPTRCPYDNEGRSASATTSRPDGGSSTPVAVATCSWPLCCSTGSVEEVVEARSWRDQAPDVAARAMRAARLRGPSRPGVRAAGIERRAY